MHLCAYVVGAAHLAEASRGQIDGTTGVTPRFTLGYGGRLTEKTEVVADESRSDADGESM